MLGIDDGIFSGNFNLADVFFLIAAVLFGVAAFVAYQVKTMYATLTAVGLCLVALAWLVL